MMPLSMSPEVSNFSQLEHVGKEYSVATCFVWHCSAVAVKDSNLVSL